MVYSEHYNFALPEDRDGYDISPLSENFESLDITLAEAEAETEKISTRIGTPTENGQTLFSLLENGSNSIIKSIQYKVVPLSSRSETTVCSITPVNLHKTFVILERLQNVEDVNMTYTLSESDITLSHINYSDGDIFIFGFWIIEFN